MAAAKITMTTKRGPPGAFHGLLPAPVRTVIAWGPVPVLLYVAAQDDLHPLARFVSGALVLGIVVSELGG